jgi:hypothetical protein
VNRSEAVVYLRRYGYAASVPAVAVESDDAAAEFLESEAGKAAVRSFQADFGTAVVDGDMGPKTERAMQTPRCGCTAEMLVAAEARGALAQHPNRDWKENPLRYGFKSYVNGVDEATQRDLAKQGTEFWMEACGIWIREAKSGEKAEVVLDTGRGRQDNFDGSSGTLAWAFVAGFLMKFDADENWTADPNKNGISWLEVFDHEFGHILGVSHLGDGNLMAPFYKRGLFKPQAGDIREVQARYGKPTWTPEEPTDPDPPPAGNGWKITQQRPDLIVLRNR